MHRSLISIFLIDFLIMHDLIEEIKIALLTLLIGHSLLGPLIDFLHLRLKTLLLIAMRIGFSRQLKELLLIELLLLLYLLLESLLLLE